MNKIIRYISIFTILFGFSVSYVTAQDAPKYLFKIATELPKGSSWHTALLKINKEVYTKTNGNVGIKVYTGGVMGSQIDVLKKIKIGQLTGGTLSGSGLTLIYDDFAVMGFPMLFQTYDEYDYLMEKIGPYFEEQFRKNDFVVLSWSETGFIYVYSKNKVYSLDTFKKSKPFKLEGDIVTAALYDEVNITPVLLNVADIITSLRTGQIDTVFNTPSLLIDLQWYTRVKYVADFPLSFMMGAIVVDRELFDSMPASYQKVMLDAFDKYFSELTPEIRKKNELAQEALKKAGITTLRVDQKDKDKFYEVCNNVALELTEERYSRDLLNRIKNIIAEYRKK